LLKVSVQVHCVLPGYFVGSDVTRMFNNICVEPIENKLYYAVLYGYAIYMVKLETGEKTKLIRCYGLPSGLAVDKTEG